MVLPFLILCPSLVFEASLIPTLGLFPYFGLLLPLAALFFFRAQLTPFSHQMLFGSFCSSVPAPLDGWIVADMKPNTGLFLDVHNRTPRCLLVPAWPGFF